MDSGNTQQDQAREREGMSLTRFLAALATSIIIFAVQVIIFLLLRNKLARILYGPSSPVNHFCRLTRPLPQQTQNLFGTRARTNRRAATKSGRLVQKTMDLQRSRSHQQMRSRRLLLFAISSNTPHHIRPYCASPHSYSLTSEFRVRQRSGSC